MPPDQYPNYFLRDNFGRTADYLRLSVTDRCDLRCTYCMAEHMTFVPRREVLTHEELYRLSLVFMRYGVRKIRITGGEPLVRKDILQLFELLGSHVKHNDLDELTLTTNGTLLSRYARDLFSAGVRRVNVSLDTLNAERYATITRLGRIEKVLSGLEAARSAGLKVKINVVAAAGSFENEVDDLIRFAHGDGMDITLIEEMPLGEVSHQRSDSHLSLVKLRADLMRRWTLETLSETTGGPAKYVRVKETGGRLGFITPLSCDFCSACNRVRVSCTGGLYTCMGNEGSVDLRAALRGSEGDAALERLIRDTVRNKPKGHSFKIESHLVKGIDRHMSVLGG
ncbi:cyclic pyranopterin phosphate synthase [Cohaesibacter marisflavi]|uniref:GTP 3',8-cyclase n=1 Tax=Cohaesibacter marisflavi TaxID=655353 RepID=A0A1I5MB42_9HYPH|nr:GTP 3',8-cyclase MoaA [Cohaesibacter marisflavi]SFP06729.1 cyclic pyranopterin phosphate synthase [Cohaesibacter marisflavi]